MGERSRRRVRVCGPYSSATVAAVAHLVGDTEHNKTMQARVRALAPRGGSADAEGA